MRTFNWRWFLAKSISICVLPLGYALGELYFAYHYFWFIRFLDRFDTPVYFFDPGIMWGPYSANWVAIATGVTSAILLFFSGNSKSSLKTISIVYISIVVTAWLTSGDRISFGYVLALLAIQSLLMFSAMAIFGKRGDKTAPAGQYSIRDVISLTVIIALTLATIKPIYFALSNGDTQIAYFRPSPIYWVFSLGACLSLISIPWLHSTAKRPYLFLLAIGSSYGGALLVSGAFKEFKILRRLDCNYTTFLNMENGYIHWFILHGVVQLGVLYFFSLIPMAANRIRCLTRNRWKMAKLWIRSASLYS